MSNFKKDLLFGQKYEILLCEKLQLKEVSISSGNFKPYDVLDVITNLKYEVKADRLAYKTGNIAIEFECNSKPSGITTTEADYYAYFIINSSGQDLYLVPVKFIKDMIDKIKLKSVYGGDGKRSKMYLIKLKDFEIFKKIS